MLETIIFGNTILQYIEVIAIAIGSLVAAKGVYWLFKKVIGVAVAKTKTKFDDVLVDNAEEPLIALLVITGLYYAITRLTLNGALVWVDNITYVAVALVLTWLALRLADAFVEYWMKPLAKKTKSKMDDQLIPIADKVIKIIIIAFAGILALSNFGYDVSALVAGLGIGGLAVALASKDYLENIVGGLTIFTDKPFQIGERVQVAGVEGTIKEVGIRSTRIMTFDDTLVIIPNSQMVTNKLVNVSAPDKSVAVKMTLGLTYDTSVKKMEKAKAIVTKAVKGTNGVDNDYKPLIYFTEFGDSALKLWVKYRIDDYGGKLGIMDKVNTKIKIGFEKAKIEMAYPTQTVYVKK